MWSEKLEVRGEGEDALSVGFAATSPKGGLGLVRQSPAQCVRLRGRREQAPALRDVWDTYSQTSRGESSRRLPSKTAAYCPHSVVKRIID